VHSLACAAILCPALGNDLRVSRQLCAPFVWLSAVVLTILVDLIQGLLEEVLVRSASGNRVYGIGLWDVSVLVTLAVGWACIAVFNYSFVEDGTRCGIRQGSVFWSCAVAVLFAGRVIRDTGWTGRRCTDSFTYVVCRSHGGQDEGSLHVY